MSYAVIPLSYLCHTINAIKCNHSANYDNYDNYDKPDHQAQPTRRMQGPPMLGADLATVLHPTSKRWAGQAPTSLGSWPRIAQQPMPPRLPETLLLLPHSVGECSLRTFADPPWSKDRDCKPGIEAWDCNQYNVLHTTACCTACTGTWL